MSGRANDQLAATVVAAITAHDVELAFVSPGSRSTPLIAALQAAGLRMHLVLDERAAAYAAVGAARAGVIAAVVTTSGTAVANLLPGLAEAERDELPIVAMTADRPQQEVDVRANQTVPQPQLLAGAARASVDLCAAGLPPSWREQLTRALGALRGPSPGPVHLNLRFDKPLTPTDACGQAEVISVAERADAPIPAAPWTGAERGLVVVGALPHHARSGVATLIDALPWPSLVDVTSGLDRARPGRFCPALLRAAEARQRLQPDRVLWIGGRLTEPAVGDWLRSADVTQWRTGDAVRASDGVSPRAYRVDFRGPLPDPASATASALDLAPYAAAFPDPPAELNEPAVAQLVADALGPDDLLFVGSSMPIRDVDRFARRLAAPVLANRGVSGIDGNVATALGAHVATGRPVTALLGDLALLHDASSLGQLTRDGAAVRVVCVNNSGGGIFHFLPIASHDSLFEPWFTAPHDQDTVAIGGGFGVAARQVTSFDELASTLRTPPNKPELLEVRTDRDANHALHVELDRRYQDALR
ncbi:MAG: 2-succinyl-5-enolpyruvyl-6-hydroxy-3-cyclohexene-1-carboxylic-acid synthase [Planctomycetota bacterium]|nr:2-succinyl-5-enolpyruvyl-6-hydroxy-3-cyclohexene-1-carboxylic-acid synthase [Planctomycetota bacterium]